MEVEYTQCIFLKGIDTKSIDSHPQNKHPPPHQTPGNSGSDECKSDNPIFKTITRACLTSHLKFS